MTDFISANLCPAFSLTFADLHIINCVAASRIQIILGKNNLYEQLQHIVLLK